MTVEANTLEFDYLGDGVSKVFPFPSRFLASSDIVVGINGTQQVGGYSVSGAGVNEGGSVTFAVAPPAGSSVVLLRDPAISQLISYDDAAATLGTTVENTVDRLTMIAQLLRRRSDKTIRISDLAVGTPPTITLPLVENEALFVGPSNTIESRPLTFDSGLFGSVDPSNFAQSFPELQSANVSRVVVFANGGRAGIFAWRLGNYAGLVAADPRQALYVQSSYFPATVGAWVRQGDWVVTGLRTSWFGLTGVDDTDAIAAATALAFTTGVKLVVHGGSVLPVSSTVVITNGVTFKTKGVGGFRQMAGKSLGDLVVLGDGSKLINTEVDGNLPQNPPTGIHVLVRIGNSNDCRVERCTIHSSAGFGTVINGGLRAVVDRNKVYDFTDIGIQVFGVDATAEHTISNNAITQIGWGAINVANANFCHVFGNKVTGLILGVPGNRQRVNLSGTTATWVSGPNFSALRKGNFLVANGGGEWRIAQVVSPTQLTLETPAPTLNNVLAITGTGDLMGIVQGSFNKVYNNTIRETTTFGFGYSLGASMAGCLGNDFYGNTIINTGKNAVNISGIHFGGGGFLENNRVFDNTIVSCGFGAGIGGPDTVAIYISNGPNPGAVLGTDIKNNTVQSYAGDGQTTFWLGTDGQLNLGAVTIEGNKQSGVQFPGVLNGVKDVVLSSQWGSTATATITSVGENSVTFNLTAGGAGRGGSGQFTIRKFVEPRSDPQPVAKCVSSTGYLPTFFGEAQSAPGNWTAFQFDATVPADGQVFTIRMKD